MNVSPASKAASSSRKESLSLTVHPKTFPPSMIAGTSIPELPSFRIRIVICVLTYITSRLFELLGNDSVEREVTSPSYGMQKGFARAVPLLDGHCDSVASVTLRERAGNF